MDFEETVRKMRTLGVLQAEFHEDGAPKLIALGPEPKGDEPPEGEDSEPRPDQIRGVRDAARRLTTMSRRSAGV